MKLIQTKVCAILLISHLTILSFSCKKTALDDNPQEENVEVNGHSLNIKVAGSGTATVILLSGLESPRQIWDQVLNGPIGSAKILSYDRAGYGASDAVSETRDGLTIVRELHSLLVKKRLNPPYIIVAHSIAGPFAQLFAAKYKSETRGIVLVDCPSDEEMALTGQIPSELFDSIFGQLKYSGSKAEIKSMAATMNQINENGGLPDLPLIVISNMLPEEGETNADKKQDFLAQKLWLDKKRSAKQWVTEKGHLVPTNDPDIIIKAINALNN